MFVVSLQFRAESICSGPQVCGTVAPGVWGLGRIAVWGRAAPPLLPTAASKEMGLRHPHKRPSEQRPPPILMPAPLLRAPSGRGPGNACASPASQPVDIPLHPLRRRLSTNATSGPRVGSLWVYLSKSGGAPPVGVSGPDPVNRAPRARGCEAAKPQRWAVGPRSAGAVLAHHFAPSPPSPPSLKSRAVERVQSCSSWGGGGVAQGTSTKGPTCTFRSAPLHSPPPPPPVVGSCSASAFRRCGSHTIRIIPCSRSSLKSRAVERVQSCSSWGGGGGTQNQRLGRLTH